VPDGKTNAQFAFEYLTASGLSPEAATGVVGNLVAESGLRTNAVGDSGLAKGIAQWHPDRWNPFVAWAKRAGRDPYSLEAQLYWVRKEADSPAGGNVWSQLLKVKDVVQAAALWMRKFERPRDQSDANAQRRAKAGIDAVKGASTLTPGADGSLLGSIGGGLGDLAGAAAEPIVTGLNQAAGTLLKGTGPIVVKGLFVALSVALIGAGVYKAAAGRAAS
jgi:hypothetical protein